MRRVAVIPTLLTLGNAVCGFASITIASKIGRDDTPLQTEFLFAASGWLIIAAMAFDVLDGFVARLSRSTSMFGLQLDSLCDAISFGLAPALCCSGWGQLGCPASAGPGDDRRTLWFAPFCAGAV